MAKKRSGAPREARSAVVATPATILGRVRLVHARLPDPGDSWQTDDDPERTEPDSVTHNYNRADVPPGAKLIALLTRDGESYTAAAVLTKGTSTSTYQRRLRLEHIVAVRQATFASLLEELPGRVRGVFSDRSQRSLALLPAKTGEAVANAMANADPRLLDALRSLVRAIERRRVFLDDRSDGWRIMAREKEAVDTALALGGLQHTTVAEEHLAEDVGPTPILKLLGGKRALEDRQIELDAAAFGGLEALHADVVGRVFWDDKAGTRVTVVNANRTKIEETLGVDLVVHYERFRSFLLIQYKRLLREDSDARLPAWRFRPSSDRNFARELARILGVREKILGQEPVSPDDYRLNEDPFYFKFCRNDRFEPDASGMTRGVHVLASDVDHFLGSEAALGPKGGAFFGFDNFSRRLPNSLFLELARQGWIGSRALATDQVAEIVAEALDASRSVMLANIVDGRAAESSAIDEDSIVDFDD